MRTTTPGRAQRWRQIGWHGQSGAFYALDEQPTLHEPGSIAPLWLLVDNEPSEQDNAAEVRAAALHDAVDKLRASAPAHYMCDSGFGCERCTYDDVISRLRTMAAAARPDAAPETEAHPARHRWAVETRDPGAGEWVPGHRFLNRHHAVERLAALTENHPTWYDGTPAQRRLVRETTTHTVEAAAAARPDDTTGA